LVSTYLINLDNGEDKIDGLSDLIELSDDFGPDYSFVYSPWLVIYESLKSTEYNTCLLLSISVLAGTLTIFLITLDYRKGVVLTVG